jgi:gliding motility-associated-like protein
MTYQKSILVLLISTLAVTFGFGQACDVTSDVNDICIGDEVRLEFLLPAPDNFGVTFNGVNQFVNIPHVADLDFGTTDFSVEFWFEPSSSPTGPVLLFSKISTSGVGYTIGYNAGLLSVVLNDGVNPPVIVIGSTPLNSNWQHCAVTFDRAGDCRIYLDGIQDAITPIAVVGSIANTDPIGVGGPAVNGGGQAVFFDGKMDEIRVWSRVLAASEITSNMNAHINPDTQLGLNGYWDLNEGSGGFVIDCGIASQDGSLMSGSSFNNTTVDLPLTWNLGVTWNTGDVGNVIFDNPDDTTRYIAEAGYCKYYCVDSLDINVLTCDSSKEDFTEASVWIPNAFTPNFDNKNDVFEIKASFISYFEVMVYSRNGNLIFHSKNIQNAWDGNVQDKKSKDDTYTYVVVYRNMKNEEFKKYGYVTVMR